MGADADVTLVDLEREQTVTPDLLLSEQDHTPFNGVKVKGWPVRTILRGRTAYCNSEVVGDPRGQFLRRPLSAT